MHILLPPSETKRSGGGAVFSPDSLRDATGLGVARARVRRALEALSQNAEAAAKPLKLGVTNRDELAYNLTLASSGAMPAIERYTGVLYDALNVAELDRSARRWASEHVLVQSALFGLIAADDLIPAYRLSASASLPGLGASLKQVWAEAHSRLDWARWGLVLDLRSKDYAALAPMPKNARGARYILDVTQRVHDGEVRALNHFNKAAKGDFVRRLARSSATVETLDQLLAWAKKDGLELFRSDVEGHLTLVTELAPVSRGGSAGLSHRAATATR